MEDNGEDCTWQLVVHLQTDTTLVIQMSVFLDRYMCVWVCAYLQPVQLSSQTALMQRLFELHLDSRQKVPPHLAGKRMTHHHGDSAEVHLMTSDITHPQSAH